MAPTKKKGKGPANGAPVDAPTDPSSSLHIDAASSSGEAVKVNNYALSELKHALDDGAKLFFNRDDCFNQSHLHEDVRIGFGWLSCVIAGGVSLYGWKMGWAATKGWTYFGVASYMIISAFLWLYARYIEKDTVYVGTKRVVSKRVLTERLTFSSRVPAFTPTYNLTLTFTQSTNGGKSLVRSHSSSANPSFGQFFDSQGSLDSGRWETYLTAMLNKARGDDPLGH